MAREQTRTPTDATRRSAGGRGGGSAVSSTSRAEARRSTIESVAYRSLAPASLLREMRPGHGLLVYSQLALVPWFEDRWRQQRTGLPR
jgi:hypothetical protein